MVVLGRLITFSLLLLASLPWNTTGESSCTFRNSTSGSDVVCKMKNFTSQPLFPATQQKTIRSVDLSQNQIQVLPPSLFLGLSNLISLDLSQNQIQELSPSLFLGLSNLTSLVLSNNNLTSLPENIFQNQGNLKNLVLINNYHLHSLPPNIFLHLPKSRVLDLTNTTITNGTCNLDSSIPIPAFTSLHSGQCQGADIGGCTQDNHAFCACQQDAYVYNGQQCVAKSGCNPLDPATACSNYPVCNRTEASYECQCAQAKTLMNGTCIRQRDYCTLVPHQHQQYQNYPGWDASYHISDRRIFAEATYGCNPGYTRAGRKIVCQSNGNWSDPICNKRHGYCKFSSEGLERFNIKTTQLSLGHIDVRCQAWRNQVARFSCGAYNEAHGTFSYEHYKCQGGPKCPQPWERMPSGKCVRRFLPMTTWQEASRTCVANNAKLVEITVREDDEYLGKWATMNDEQTFHMGISVLLQGNTYLYFYSSSKRNLTFQNWDHNEPNTKYRCGVKFIFGKWRMGDCNDRRPFVCERYCPPPWKEMPSGKCVQFFPQPLNFSSAQEVCEDWLGKLVEIDSQRDDDYLSALTNDYKDTWIGIKRHADNGNFQFASSEKTVTHTNWLKGNGILKSIPNTCGVINYHTTNPKHRGRWYAIKCTFRRAFICEKGFDVDIPKGACTREDLLALVTNARFPENAVLRNGSEVEVNDCGLGYHNTEGTAICFNGSWKLSGCNEQGIRCGGDPPTTQHKKYPGWDGTFILGGRGLFAEATYNCYFGYTRGNHKIVCQRNGAWTNPNCYKTPGYCKIPENRIEQYNITEIYVGSINVPCAPWKKTGRAILWCDIYNKDRGTFSSKGSCSKNNPNFCPLLPENYSFKVWRYYSWRWLFKWYRWGFERTGNNYDLGTTARVVFQKECDIWKRYCDDIKDVPRAHIICATVKIGDKYEGRFVMDDKYTIANSKRALSTAYNKIDQERKDQFCKSILFEEKCGAP